MKRLPVPMIIALAAPASAGPRTETAVLAGGCFWGMEAVFEHVKGVTDVVSGYAGGSLKDANYDRVSSERTGHADQRLDRVGLWRAQDHGEGGARFGAVDEARHHLQMPAKLALS